MSGPQLNGLGPHGERLYRLLLHALPRSSRVDFEDEMVLLLSDRLAEAGRSSRERTLTWSNAIWDVLRHAASDRLARNRSSTGSPSPGWSRVESFGQDIRFGIRTLARAPGFALVATLTLAIGIGATTVMFSLVNGVLLQPLDFESPEELVWIRELTEAGVELTASYPNFADWREQTRSFEGLASGFPIFTQTARGAGEPLTVRTLGVSRDFFEILGAPPLLGRTIDDDENRPGGEFTVVVSQRFWNEQLNGSTDLSEVTLELQDAIAQVVGVMPNSFHFLDDVDIWWGHERAPIQIRNAHNYWVVGRLRAGVPIAVAHAELDAIAASVNEAYPDETSSAAVAVRTLHEQVVGATTQPLILLFGGAGLLLLIACTNVASTLLARGADRRREFAIRHSVGAGRGRLISQLLTESLMLSLVGAIAGSALALGLLRVIRTQGATMVPRIENVGLDAGFLLFALAVTGGAAAIFGLFPAWQLLSGGHSGALRGGRGGGVDRRQSRLWRALIGAEVALAVLLLVGSGLLVRSFAAILNAELGYAGDHIVSATFTPARSQFPSRDDKLVFVQQVLDNLRSLPGVESVGLTGQMPMDGFSQTGPVLVPPFSVAEDPDEWDAQAGFRIVDEGVFEALSIPLIQGRFFEQTDAAGTPPVAIVNTSLARRLWPGENPIGKQVVALWDFEQAMLTVVGLVGEARHWAREQGDQPEIYMSFRQRPVHIQRGVNVVVRTSGQPRSLLRPMAERFASLDPQLRPVFRTVPDVVQSSVSDRRFTMMVLVGFAIAGVTLTIVGIYGVVAYAVSRRTREIGIRIALGARTSTVMTMVQGNMLRWVLGGVVVGLAVALSLGRVVEALLYDITARDPIVYLVAAGMIASVAYVASYIPARRSTRVDPAVTMRTE